MKIGFTLKPKDGNIEDFEKQIEDLEKIGAGSAEIPLYELDVVCGKKIIKDELKLLNKFTLKSNLKFSIHGSMSVNLLDEDYLEEHLQVLEKEIQVCSDLNIKILVTHFGHTSVATSQNSRIGMVPQELNLESFETVFDTVSYSRGLYGKSPKPEHIKKILKDLSLWDKKDQRLRQLSGGMKRRVLIAKALSHEPKILFLDEPTAGVDVELRRDMWMVVDDLRKTGVTIILTTHYIEEAEAIADRVAVINQGEIIVVEDHTDALDQV